MEDINSQVFKKSAKSETEELSDLLLCPKCKYNPITITSISLQNSFSLTYNCSLCSNSPSTIPLEEYLNQIPTYDSIRKEICFIHHEKNSEYFCMECQKSFCEDCCTYHRIIEKDHHFSFTKINLVQSCPFHKQFIDMMCVNCNKLICRECKIEHNKEKNKNILMIRDFWFNVLDEMIYKNYEELDKEMTKNEETIENLLTVFLGYIDQIINDFNEIKETINYTKNGIYRINSNNYKKFAKIVFNTFYLCNDLNCYNYDVITSMRELNRVFKEEKEKMKQVEEVQKGKKMKIEKAIKDLSYIIKGNRYDEVQEFEEESLIPCKGIQINCIEGTFKILSDDPNEKESNVQNPSLNDSKDSNTVMMEQEKQDETILEDNNNSSITITINDEKEEEQCKTIEKEEPKKKEETILKDIQNEISLGKGETKKPTHTRSLRSLGTREKISSQISEKDSTNVPTNSNQKSKEGSPKNLHALTFFNDLMQVKSTEKKPIKKRKAKRSRSRTNTKEEKKAKSLVVSSGKSIPKEIQETFSSPPTQLQLSSDEAMINQFHSKDSDLFFDPLCRYECQLIIKGFNYSVVSIALIAIDLLVIGQGEWLQNEMKLRRKNPTEHRMVIWSLSKDRMEGALIGHTKTVTSIVLLKDGRLASASFDKTIRIWNIQKRKCVFTFTDHQKKIRQILQLKTGVLVSISEDKTVKFWNIVGYSCIKSVSISSVVYKMIEVNNNTLLMCFKDKKLHRLNTTTFEQNYTLSLPSIATSYLHLGKNGILVGEINGNTHLVSSNFKTKESRGKWHRSAVSSLIQLKSKYIVSSGFDHCVKIWDSETWKNVAIMTHNETVTCLTPLQFDSFLSGSGDKTVKLWKKEDKSTI